jgi:hypothetical protein
MRRFADSGDEEHQETHSRTLTAGGEQGEQGRIKESSYAPLAIPARYSADRSTRMPRQEYSTGGSPSLLTITSASEARASSRYVSSFALRQSSTASAGVKGAELGFLPTLGVQAPL